jgi:hypothetical protein
MISCVEQKFPHAQMEAVAPILTGADDDNLASLWLSP